MGPRALRFAFAPLLVGLLLGDLGAAPEPDPLPRRRARAACKFQEIYRERLVRYREDGESWVDVASSETFKIKAVIPFERGLTDPRTFDGDTEFDFSVGEAYYSGNLGDDPRYVRGDTSARVVVDEEEIWDDEGENVRIRPITIVRLQWTDEAWTISVQQRPYVDSEEWDDDGSYIVAPDWADVEEDYEEPPVEGEEDDGAPFRMAFSETLENGCWFALGTSAMYFDGRYSGITRGRTVVAGSGEDAEEFYLNHVRLRGKGTAPDYSGDDTDPTLALDAVVEQRDESGAITGLYVSGEAADAESGVYLVLARVGGGDPVVLFTSAGMDEWPTAIFDGVVPVAASPGILTITVYDLDRNSVERTIPFGEP